VICVNYTVANRVALLWWFVWITPLQIKSKNISVAPWFVWITPLQINCNKNKRVSPSCGDLCELHHWRLYWFPSPSSTCCSHTLPSQRPLNPWGSALTCEPQISFKTCAGTYISVLSWEFPIKQLKWELNPCFHHSLVLRECLSTQPWILQQQLVLGTPCLMRTSESQQ